MPALRLRPTHKPIRDYYQSLKQYSLLHASHEGAVSEAFGTLLQNCAKQFSWKLVNQFEIKRRKQNPLRVDGALVDPWSLVHGLWEAKDEHDDLALEVKKKIAKGYPTENILFQAPERAILYQGGKRILDESLKDPSVLVDVLKEFFRYQPPVFDQWERAVAEFREKVPQLGRALLDLIEKERKENPFFVQAFAQFVDVCRRSLNPSLSETAVEKMLAQHVLTERIFRTVFDNADFVRRNAVASEIEQVIDQLTRRSWNREKFLAGLDRFYGAIEETARSINDFSEKQGFLNTVYENFFQGFDAKTADTHGIVYTPQPIVKFMVRSVDEILNKEFGQSLGEPGVHILDPFVGTGNFLLHIMRQIPKSRLPKKYANELHANEVLLLPYYVASMNIEHEYAEAVGEYQPFEGLCLVDTFELAETKQQSLLAMTEKNAERVERQRKSPITVIIGNPPYNVGQEDENDKNQNRSYPDFDKDVYNGYAKGSDATLLNQFKDPYIRAFWWASKRIKGDGVVALITNSSFVHKNPFDIMRQRLQRDFSSLWIVDLGGDVRSDPKLSGTKHNVFGIQAGVAITILVKNAAYKNPGTIHYIAADHNATAKEKLDWLDRSESLSALKMRTLVPDAKRRWITNNLVKSFDLAMPLAIKKRQGGDRTHAIFRIMSNGVKSNADPYMFSFDEAALCARARAMVEAYNSELDRWQRAERTKKNDGVLRVDLKVLKWVRKTKRFFLNGTEAKFDDVLIRKSLYRPYTTQFYYMDRMFNEDLYSIPKIVPSESIAVRNRILITTTSSQIPFLAQICNSVPCQDVGGRPSQCFPFYVYEGDKRQENITDWALTAFRTNYNDPSITKWDIFHYVYSILHHRVYRARYEANLRKELPRIPFAPDFRGFVKAGALLVELHVDYQKQREWRLTRLETPDEPLNWRVERMKLTRDKTSIVYNNFLTLSGIPPEAFEYRLGNRSAIDWLIDQYQVSTDPRSGITNDPNRLDDEEYIVRLIGQVITVSVETVKIVKALPPLDGDAKTDGVTPESPVDRGAGPKRPRRTKSG